MEFFRGDTARLSSSGGPIARSARSQHLSSDNTQAAGSGLRCLLFSFFHMRKGHNQGLKTPKQPELRVLEKYVGFF